MVVPAVVDVLPVASLAETGLRAPSVDTEADPEPVFEADLLVVFFFLMLFRFVEANDCSSSDDVVPVGLSGGCRGGSPVDTGFGSFPLPVIQLVMVD